jgi:periplasmic protein TonB
MAAQTLKSLQRRLRFPRMAYEEKVFNLIFLVVLLIGLSVAEYLQHIRVPKDLYLPGPELRKVAEVQIREPVERPPEPVVEPPKPEPAPRKLTEEEKKKLTAPPPSSAVGTPKQMPKKPEDLQKMVARKGLLGMLSSSTGDTTPRAYQPSKKRDVSEELLASLQDLSESRAADDDNDFLGVGNLPEVARRGTDIGYILDAARIGEIVETQVEFYGGIEDLPEAILEEWESDKGGRTSSDIRRIVASYLGGLRYLYNKELRKDPALQGRLVVRFEISPSGRVTLADLVDSTLGAPVLEEAILSSIQKWKFPRIPDEGGAVRVTYPFVFVPPTS